MRVLLPLLLAGCVGTQVGGVDAAAPELGAAEAGPVDPCHDGVQRGDETDVDCGGNCGKCPAMKGCKGGADCESGLCSTCGLGLHCVTALGCDNAGAPRLDAVTPASYTSCSCQSFVLKGAGFAEGAMVVLQDVALGTTSPVASVRVSDTELRVNDVCNAAAPQVGNFRVWVRNPDQVESAPQDFAFTRSAPVVLTVSPSTIARGAVFCPSFTLAQTGGVCAGATWEAGGCGAANQVGTLGLTVGSKPDQASTTGAQCLTIPDTLTPGTYCVWVRNSDGVASSNTATQVTVN